MEKKFIPTGKTNLFLKNNTEQNCNFLISSKIKEHQHTRFNPLTGQWVLVSPHRMKRPWSGQEEQAERNQQPEFDPTNP